MTPPDPLPSLDEIIRADDAQCAAITRVNNLIREMARDYANHPINDIFTLLGVKTEDMRRLSEMGKTDFVRLAGIGVPLFRLHASLTFAKSVAAGTPDMQALAHLVEKAMRDNLDHLGDACAIARLITPTQQQRIRKLNEAVMRLYKTHGTYQDPLCLERLGLPARQLKYLSAMDEEVLAAINEQGLPLVRIRTVLPGERSTRLALSPCMRALLTDLGEEGAH